MRIARSGLAIAIAAGAACTTTTASPGLDCSSFPTSIHSCVEVSDVVDVSDVVRLAIDAALKESGRGEELRRDGLCLAWSNNLDLPSDAMPTGEAYPVTPLSRCHRDSNSNYFGPEDGATRGLLVLQCFRAKRDLSGDLVVDGFVRARPGATHGFSAFITLGDRPALRRSETTWYE